MKRLPMPMHSILLYLSEEMQTQRRRWCWNWLFLQHQTISYGTG